MNETSVDGYSDTPTPLPSVPRKVRRRGWPLNGIGRLLLVVGWVVLTLVFGWKCILDLGWLAFGSRYPAVVTDSRMHRYDYVQSNPHVERKSGTHFHIYYRFNTNGKEIKGTLRVSEAVYRYLTDAREPERRNLIVKHFELLGGSVTMVEEYESSLGRWLFSLFFFLILAGVLAYLLKDSVIRDYVERRLYVEGEAVRGRVVSKEWVVDTQRWSYWKVVYEFQNPVSGEWIKREVEADWAIGEAVSSELTILVRRENVRQDVAYELGRWELDI